MPRIASVKSRVCFTVALVVVPLLFLAQRAAAQSVFTGNSNSDYSTASNWNPSGAPTTGSIIIGETAFNNVTANYTTSASITDTSTTGNLFIGDGTGATGTLTMSGSAGTLTYNFGGYPNGIDLGYNGGTGNLNVNAGTLAIAGGDISVGEVGASTGTLTVGGGSVSVGRLTIGDGVGATAIVNLNSGQITVNTNGGNEGILFGGGGAGTGTQGTLNLNGGTLYTTEVTRYVTGGTYVFNFNGGTMAPTAGSTSLASFLAAGITYKVQTGGAIFDTTNAGGTALVVSQPLVHDSSGPATDGGVTKNGSGTLTLSSSGNTYTGGTTVNNGTLIISGATMPAGAVTINSGAGGGTLSFAETNHDQYTNATSTTINAGGTLTMTGGFSAFIHNLTLAGGTLADSTPHGTYGSWNFFAAESIHVTGGTASTISALNIDSWQGGFLNFNVDSASTLNVTGTIGDTGHTGFGVNLIGGGTLTLSGANTYNAATTVTAGTLNVTAGSLAGGTTLAVGIGAAGTMTVSGSAGTLTYSGQVSVGSSSGGSGTLNVNAGTVTTSADVILGTNSAASGTDTVTVGGGTLAMTGSGRLIIADAANVTTIVNLNSGAITTGSLIYGGGNASGTPNGTINLNGGTLTASSIFEFTTSVASTFNFAGGTLKPTVDAGGFMVVDTANVKNGGAIIDTNSHNITIAQILQHFAGATTDGLTKNGLGTLTLSGANTFTGNVIINQGQVTANANHALGAIVAGRTVTVNSGASLVLNANDAIDIGSTTPNDTTLAIVGGTVSSNNVFTRFGNVTLTGGTLSDGGGAGSFRSFYFGTLTGGANATVTVNGAARSTINQTGGTNNGVDLGPNTVFNVGVTGDPTIDLALSATLTDQGSGGANAAGAFTKTGAGVMAVTGTNTYSGGTTITGGVLSFANGSLGPSGSIKMNGGTLQWNGSNTQDISTRLLMVNATNATFDTQANSVTLGSAFGGATSGSLTMIGSGTLTLGGANTYTGGDIVSNGTLSIASDAASGSAAPLGVVPSSATANNIILNGGTLSASAGLTLNANRGIGIGPAVGGTGGSGTLASATLGQTLIYNGSIVSAGNSGVNSLNKTGAGILVLGGASTYNGATNVNGGALYVNGSLNSAGTIAVAASTTLGGTGSAGTATIAASGILEAGQGGLGTLSLTGLTFSGAAAVNIGSVATNYNAGLSGPLAINDTGSLAASGAANSVTFNLADTSLTTGTYRLIGYSGSIGGTGLSAFKIGSNTAFGVRQTSQLQSAVNPNNSSLNEIELVVSGDFPDWTGASSSEWSTNQSVLNWKLHTGGTATYFITGDSVHFTSAATNQVVDVSQANVAPLSASFDSGAYTLESTPATFGISSTASVTINGGSLLVTAPNTYSGQTTVSGGTLRLGVAPVGSVGSITSSAIGTGTLSMAGGQISSNGGTARTILNPVTLAGDSILGDTTTNGALSFQGPMTLSGNRQLTINSQVTLAGGVSGAGLSLTKLGAGTLILSGTNNYGDTVIGAGTLRVGSTNALPYGSGNGNLVLNGGATAGTLDLAGLGANVNGLSGTTGTVRGQIINSTSSTTATLAVGNNNASSVFAGLIADNAGSGGIVALAKTGSGNFQLTGQSTYSGGTAVNQGTLTVGVAGAIPSSGAVIINAATVNVATGGNNGYASAAATTINAGGLLTMASGASLLHNLTLAGGTLADSAPDGTFGTWGFNTSTTVEPIHVTGGVTSTMSASKFDSAWGNALTFNVESGSTLNVSGTIGGNSGHPAFGVTVTGGGAVTLANVNAFAGNILVSAGTLTTSVSGGLGANTSGKTVTIAPGATLVSTATDAMDYLSTTVNNLAFTIQGTWNNNPANTASTGFQRVDNLTLQGATINDYGQHPGSFGGILMNGTVTVSGAAASTYNQLGGGVGLGVLSTTFNVAPTGGAGADFTVNGTIRNTPVGAGNFIKSGAGTMLLTAASSYTGGTTISNGVLRVANTTGSATGTGGVTLNGGTLASGTVGTISGAVDAGMGLGAGAHAIAPGGIGSIGTLNLGSTLSLNNNSTLDFDVIDATKDLLAVTGQLTLNGTPNVAVTGSGVLSGSYTLATFANTPGLNNSSFNVTSVPAGYRLQVDPTDLKIVIANSSSLSLSPLDMVVRSMVGGNQTGTATLTNSDSTYDATFGTTPSGNATATASTGTVAHNNGMTAVAIGFTNYMATGARSGTVAFTNTANSADSFNTSGNVFTLDSGSAVVDNRVVTASSVSLGAVHVGGTGSGISNLTTTGDDNNFTRVTVNTTLFNSAGSTGSYNLSQMFSSIGAVTNGSVTLTTTGEGLAGEAPINVNVAYTAQVFSGQQTWNPTLTMGGWSADADWNDLNSNAGAGAPGLAGSLSASDTATFDNATATTTISLGSSSPHVAAITFANTNASGFAYTIAQGGSGVLNLDNGAGTATITAKSGGHQITAPIALDSNLSVTVMNAANTLAINGQISGTSRTLTKLGAGTLSLGNTNSYTGGTTVTAGTLRTTADGALAGGALTVNPSSGSATVQFSSNETVTSLSSAPTGATALLTVDAGKTLNVGAGGANAATTVTLGASSIVNANTGLVEIDGVTNLGTGSALNVNNTATLKLNLAGANPTVSTGVTATVAAGATLELDGTTSALADPTALSSYAGTSPPYNPALRAAIKNDGTLAVGAATASTVGGTVQQVGGIDGISTPGSVVVSDGASLTADHINQTSLVIGAGSTFTLAPSDSNGNPMVGLGSAGSSLALAGSLIPASSFISSSGSLIGAGSISSAASLSLGGVSGSSVSAVPEPSAIALFIVGCIGLVAVARGKRAAG